MFSPDAPLKMNTSQVGDSNSKIQVHKKKIFSDNIKVNLDKYRKKIYS